MDILRGESPFPLGETDGFLGETVFFEESEGGGGRFMLFLLFISICSN